MVLLRRMVIMVWGVGMAVWHVCRVRVVEVDWWIMALVDMVCVHDMTVACIAHGWKELEEAQRVGWAHGGGNKDRAEGAGRDDGGAGGRGKRKRARRREGDGRERASTERWDALSRGRRETETRQPIITLYFPHYFPYPPPTRSRTPAAFPFRGYPPTGAAARTRSVCPSASASAFSSHVLLPPTLSPSAPPRHACVRGLRCPPAIARSTVCGSLRSSIHRPLGNHCSCQSAAPAVHAASAAASMPPSKLLIMISILSTRPRLV